MMPGSDKRIYGFSSNRALARANEEELGTLPPMPAGLSGASRVGEKLWRRESPRRWVGDPLAKQISFMFLGTSKASNIWFVIIRISGIERGHEGSWSPL